MMQWSFGTLMTPSIRSWRRQISTTKENNCPISEKQERMILCRPERVLFSGFSIITINIIVDMDAQHEQAEEPSTERLTEAIRKK